MNKNNIQSGNVCRGDCFMNQRSVEADESFSKLYAISIFQRFTANKDEKDTQFFSIDSIE
jgi:hypothetical protein